MSESIELFGQALGLVISLVGAVWVWQDSRRLKAAGASLAPALWAALVFLFWIVSLPAYLILRQWRWKKDVEESQVDPDARSTGDEERKSVDAGNSEERCSEAAIRDLTRTLSHLARAEAWEKIRDHYYENACGNVMDVGRFEMIVLETLEEGQRE